MTTITKKILGVEEEYYDAYGFVVAAARKQDL